MNGRDNISFAVFINFNAAILYTFEGRKVIAVIINKLKSIEKGKLIREPETYLAKR